MGRKEELKEAGLGLTEEGEGTLAARGSEWPQDGRARRARRPHASRGGRGGDRAAVAQAEGGESAVERFLGRSVRHH